MFVFVLVVLLLALCVYKLATGAWHLWMIREIPGPKAIPIIGNILCLHQPKEKLLDTLHQIAREFGPIYKLTAIWMSLIVITSPEDAEILISGMKNLKKNFLYDNFKVWLNEGLFTSPAKKWHTRRKMLNPAFHINIIKRFTTIFIEQSEAIVGEIGDCLGETIDVVPLATKFAFLTVCETAFGANVDPAGILAYREELHKLDHIFVHRSLHPWLLSPFLYVFSPKFYEGLLVTRRLHKYTMNIIKNRKQTFNPEILSTSCEDEDVDGGSIYKGKKRLALLDLLLAANLRHDIDMRGIREEVDTTVLGGHDTTKSCLSFALMLLACNKEVQDKAVEELRELLPNEKDKVTFNDLNNMKYLGRVIKECLRLYPPGPMFGRETSETIRTHGGYIIPKGSQVMIRVFDMHRNPDIYPEPEKFDPDRFLPEQVQNRHPFAFLGFSAGPRNCIGQKVAMFEMKAFLSAILRNFEILPVDTPNTIVLMPGIVLYPKNGIRVKFVSRFNK